ncbi:MAG: Ig-like domain-containing protein [Proteobacteria bacterium]|nr:Ig-like domain-containing protein [Pseudomonadota bacterium]
MVGNCRNSSIDMGLGKQAKLSLLTSLCGLSLIAAATCFQSCSKDEGSSSVAPTMNLGLTDPGVVAAEFKFPNDSYQNLAAPVGNSLEGAAITVEPNAFEKSLVISVTQSVPLVSADFVSELGVSDLLAGAGNAVLFTGSKPVDSKGEMRITIPWNGQTPGPNVNLVVVQRKVVRELGGRVAIGMIPASKLSIGEKTVSFSSRYFGAFQVAQYSGDPSTVKEVESNRGNFSATDSAVLPPEAFSIQTPSGVLTSRFPIASWSQSKGASSYDLEVASDKDCSKNIIRARGIGGGTRTLDGLAEGTYYLCVWAVSSAGTRTPASNNGFSFTLNYQTMGTFSLLSSRSFASSTPTFTWSNSSGANRYIVQIGKNAGCTDSTGTSTITSEPSYKLTQPRADGAYWLCVLATDLQGIRRQWMDSESGRPAGEGISFTIDTTAPGLFEIGGIGGPKSSISWALSSEAAYYNLVIATDALCQSVVRTYNQIVSSTGIIPISGLEDGKSYSLCMTAVDMAGNIRQAKNSGQIFSFDITSPKVLSVTTKKPNGSYKSGETIDIAVQFTEAVKYSSANGGPTLALNSGGTAKISSGSGTAVWMFQYVVGASQQSNKLDYTNINSMALDGAAATDTAGNVLIPALAAPGSASSLSGSSAIVIDTLAPTLRTATPANGAVDVPVQTEIVLVLSEAIIEAGVESAVVVTKATDGASVSANFTVRFDAQNLTLKLTPKPNFPLLAKTNYVVTVRGVKDLAKNDLLEQIIRFTTK